MYYYKLNAYYPKEGVLCTTCKWKQPSDWKLPVDMLPDGIWLDENTGELKGIPDIGPNSPPTTYKFTIQVTESVSGSFDYGVYTITVYPEKSPSPVKPIITSTSPLPPGEKDKEYPPFQFEATGGNPPFKWYKSQGELPPGLSLSIDGVLSGTPTKEGNFTFWIYCIDTVTGLESDIKEFSISITSPGKECGYLMCENKNISGCKCGTAVTAGSDLWCCAEKDFVGPNRDSCVSVCAGPHPLCGNGKIDSGEDCDGTNLGGKTCKDFGFTGGTLVCKSTDCTFDTSGCTGGPGVCDNDGVCETGETYENCPNDCRGGGGITVTITSPTKWKSLQEMINAITSFLYAFSLVVVPLMIIIAGFFFVTAAGDPKKIEDAKRIILYALIGFIIILLAKGIISVLEQTLGSKTPAS
jgi:hypothetical protein